MEIVPEQAEFVRKIYDLSFYQEFGSMKIAKTLNANEYAKKMAPGGEWKCGTIAGILTNPVYAGYPAYKRRERIGGTYHRQAQDAWVMAEKPEPGIRIIDDTLWNLVQEKRKERAARYHPAGTAREKDQKPPVISRNDGILSLRDILYCGCCGRKMANGTRYSYWTLQSTGEKRSRKIPLYRCPSAHNGIPHNGSAQFQADVLETAVFRCLADYIGWLLKEDDLTVIHKENLSLQKKALEAEQKHLQKELVKITQDIRIMQEHIPDAMSGTYPFSVTELADAIRRHTEKKDLLEKEWDTRNDALKKFDAETTAHVLLPQEENRPPLTWVQVFEGAAAETKRVIVNRLLERIEISKEQLIIRFRNS